MKKLLLLLMGFVAPYLSLAQESATNAESTVSSDVALWQNIFNWSVISISILLAIFLLLGLREIRRSFIPG
ncbi:MAG: hypothetical protein MI810_23040 [Flavobacteriales bacterium]|jgi:hypothetical protein|nr:hypothetical protein [Flavobacteriales bacterium]